MSNYNERLDEILMGVWHKGYNRCNQEKNHPDGYDNYAFAIEPKQAKQALTSLIKELVAEAKPEEYKNYYTSNPVEKGHKMGYNEAVREFEQNLSKELEEVSEMTPTEQDKELRGQILAISDQVYIPNDTKDIAEIDETTPDELKALVGFCEKDQEWYHFTEPDHKHDCGNLPSNRVGFQITSQRTFNPAAKKMTKAQLKKMGGDGA